jgi:hypothetical protein
MTTRYSPQQLAEIINDLDREERRALVEQEVAERLARERRGPAPELKAIAPQPKRRDMTAAEKSRYIEAHGIVEYQKLPWS